MLKIYFVIILLGILGVAQKFAIYEKLKIV